MLQMRRPASFPGPGLPTAALEAPGSAQLGMCHSHGEATCAGNVLRVPGAHVPLPSAPCARAGRGHTSFCLVPNVQGGTSQQLLYRAQLIQVVAACAGALKAPKDSR